MSKLTALKDNILCTDGAFGEQKTQSGIIIQKTIGKDEGIHPRWFKVFEVGPEVDEIKPGQWVYVSYGRWTEGFDVKDDRFDTENKIKRVWKVERESCLLVSDTEPDTITLGNFSTVKSDF